MSTVLHHQHLRQRIHEKHEQYPHPVRHKRILDRLIYVVGIVQPLTILPQVYNIWVLKEAGGISVFTFTSFALFDLVWIYYGVVHKERPIILMYCLWAILNSSIVIGTLLYG